MGTGSSTNNNNHMQHRHLTDQEVFKLTKTIFTQMKGNMDANYVGEKQKLQKFMQEIVQPLYPAKRNLHTNSNEQDATQQSSKNDHLHKKQQLDINDNINNAKNSSDIKNIDNKNDKNNINNKSLSQQLIKINNESLQKLPQQLQNSQSSQTEEQLNDSVEKYSFKQLCFYLGIGNFICCKSYPPDPVYEDLGLGICLYLKFMKHLVYTLLVMSILPIMQIVFFYSIAASNNYQPASNYQRTLFAFSIGTLSLQGIKCSHQTLNSTKSYSFQLTCPIGDVRILGPVYSNSNLANLRACKEDINLWLAKGNYYIPDNGYTSTTTCNASLPACTYDISLSQQSTSFIDISITYECINGKSKFGGILLSRSTALICSIIFDLIFIVGMVIFFWSETLAESREKAWFKAKQLMLDQFTVEVGEFNNANFVEEFGEFLKVLKKIMSDNNANNDNNNFISQKNVGNSPRKNIGQDTLFYNIVQIRLPDNIQFLTIQQKRKQQYKKFYQLIGQEFLDHGNRNPQMYIDTEDFITHAFKSQKKYAKYKQKLQKRVKKYLKVHEEIDLLPQQKKKVYIVFSKPKYKRYLLENTVIIKGDRYLHVQQRLNEQQLMDSENPQQQQPPLSSSSQQQQKKYTISEPPAPAVILWDNKTKTHKLLRNIISWTVTILLVGATYILIAFMLWQQNRLLKNYNFNIQCNTLYPDNPYTPFSQSLYNLNPQSYINCYCLSKSIFLFINNQPQCSQWTKQYSLFIMIPIIFSIAIVVINVIISLIYRALSKFQAHDYLTTQLYSYIIKKTFLLILNLALIIIVLSIDTKAGISTNSTVSFLFQGTYNDITADWYLQVGLIITMTMIFNLLSPFVDTLVFIILTIVKKIAMKIFHKRPQYKRLKSALLQFYRDQYFPIQERYALVLAVLTITLCLNCVVPLMTIILLLTLFFLEINDKVLIIKAFQKPINFNNQLHSKFMKTLLVILILHLIVTALLITQPFLLVAGQPTLEGSIKDVNLNRFQAFFQTGYIIPYALLFVIILLSVCVNFASKLYLKSKPNQRVSLGLDGVPYEQQKFYRLLNKYELRRTYALKKKQINMLGLLDGYYKGKCKISDDNRMNEEQQRAPLQQQIQDIPQIDSSTNIINNNKTNNNSVKNGSKIQSYSNLPLDNNNQLSQQKSILQSIAQYSLGKLENRLKQNIQDKQRLVKLTGMTVYDWNRDWVFFNQYPQSRFQIKGLDEMLKDIGLNSNHIDNAEERKPCNGENQRL